MIGEKLSLVDETKNGPPFGGPSLTSDFQTSLMKGKYTRSET
jgi:hypothetical protein